jgi:hypothetical protein
LEFNYDFINLLLKEYQAHDKLFTYNKLQTCETCNVILQIFLTAIEYITFIEELRLQGRYEQFAAGLLKKRTSSIMNNTGSSSTQKKPETV